MIPSRRFSAAGLPLALLTSLPRFGGPARLDQNLAPHSSKVGQPSLALTSTFARRGAVDNLRVIPERKVVAREGLEPSKPLGRQIYSLLRLTASLPRQAVCVGMPCLDNI